MGRREVVLRNERGPGGERHLVARLVAGGGVQIVGQDLRGDVSVLGAGVSEYEYAWSISAADVPRLVEALAGTPDSDVLALIGRRFKGRAEQIGDVLTANAIDGHFWSRFD
jgi:hypothetical protein